MKLSALTVAILAASVACACTESEARSDDSAAARVPAYVDSAMTIEEGLRRFRDGLAVATELTGGASHRDTLIRRFVAAVERGDIEALRSMVLNRAEFAYLYYPSSPYTRPPTQQLPALAWFLILENSQKGINRVYDRYANQPLGYITHSCAATPREANGFRFWDGCVLALREVSGHTAARRLFGSIIERNGRFKFFSYNNDL